MRPLVRRLAMSASIVVALSSLVSCDQSGGEAEPTFVPLTVGATTSTSDPRTLPGYPRVCAMVDFAHFDAVTGATATTSQEGALRGVVTCTVSDADGEKLGAVSAGPADGFAEFRATPGATEVDGIGEAAVRAEGELHILVGSEHLTVKLYPGAQVPPDSLDAAIDALAIDVVARYLPPLTD